MSGIDSRHLCYGLTRLSIGERVIGHVNHIGAVYQSVPPSNVDSRPHPSMDEAMRRLLRDAGREDLLCQTR